MPAPASSARSTGFPDSNVREVNASRSCASFTGGVRYFFSKHVTFDGVRSQSNYGGLAESAIQAKINLAIPTHGFRDRLVGN